MTMISAPDAEYRGSPVPDDQAIASPGASWPVELAADAPVIPVGLPAAVEMPSLWKAKSASHSDLEISHRTRDSHRARIKG